MTRCDWCYSAPASVFTPQVALCAPCRVELERQEAEDNAAANAPTCATDGAVLNASGSCPECVVRSLVGAHNDMRRVS